MSSSEMHPMTNCPGDETLAAFVDDRLDDATRQEVVAHLADCADCRDIVLIASEAAADAPKVVRPGFGTRKFLPLVAAAAAVLVLFGIPAVRERILPGNPMSDLAEIAEAAPLRASVARLSVDDAYKPAKDTMRGGKDAAPEVVLENAALDAKERSERVPSVENLHAYGVAAMLEGKGGDAVTALEAASRKAKKPSPALLNDLAAAYLAVNDGRRALEAADRAAKIEPSPAASWNRALALTQLLRDDEAIAAWDRYIELESDPAWDEAARRQIEQIRELR
jgi:tetratricopeptide (TPR) repeat protein